MEDIAHIMGTGSAEQKKHAQNTRRSHWMHAQMCCLTHEVGAVS